MANLLIRNLDDAVYEELKAQAKANHRSISAEARLRLAQKPAYSLFDGNARWEKLREFSPESLPDPEGQSVVDMIREMRDER